LENLGACLTVHLYQIERPLTWEETLDVFDSAPDKLALFDLWVLVPGHEPVFGELLELAAVKVQAVLAHVVLVALEKVEHEVLQLRVVSPINGARICHLLCISFIIQQVFSIDWLELFQVLSHLLSILLVSNFFADLRRSVLPVLIIATEDTLVKCQVLVILQLQSVHSRAFKAMESFRAGLALDGSTLGIAPITVELLLMDQVLQSFAYVHPFFALDAKLRHLVHLDAILVEHEWQADHFCLSCIFIFAEGTDEGLVCFLAKCTDLHGLTGLSCFILNQDVIFIGLCSRRVWLSHSFLDLFG